MALLVRVARLAATRSLAWMALWVPPFCAAAGMLGCSSRGALIDDHLLDPCSADAGSSFTEEEVAPGSAVHTESPLPYDDKPPTGGPHSRCWGTWGSHSTPLPPERLVHNLEHGGVALLFNCPEGCEKERLWLQQFAEDHELTVMTEYPRLGTRFGLSSWSARAYSDCLDPAFVRRFYERHVDRGPERFSRPPPQPPASCR